MTNNTPAQILAAIKKADTVGITLHRRPDGDSLGSSQSLAYILEKELGKKVIIVSPDQLPAFLEPFISHEIEFGKSLDDVEADVYLMPDCGSWKKEELTKEFSPKSLISIDHHESNEGFCHVNYVQPKISSTCAVLFDLVKEWGFTFDKELAKRLIIGMFTDTGGFKFGTSLGQDIEKLGFLLNNTDVDYADDILIHLTKFSYASKKLWGIVLYNLEKHDDFGMSCISLAETKKNDIDLKEIRGGISAIQDIKELSLACTLTELEGGSVKGSFRSKDDSARRFAEVLGGGGHDRAAAFTLENISLEDAKKKVLEVVGR